MTHIFLSKVMFPIFIMQGCKTPCEWLAYSTSSSLTSHIYLIMQACKDPLWMASVFYCKQSHSPHIFYYAGRQFLMHTVPLPTYIIMQACKDPMWMGGSSYCKQSHSLHISNYAGLQRPPVDGQRILLQAVSLLAYI